MRKLHVATVPLLVVATVALAQESASPTINALDINIERVEFRVDRADGGCHMTAIATVQSPSIEPHYLRTEYAYNGNRCRNLKEDALLAVKRDMRRVGVLIGDGGTP